jgi:hypothetical protein
LGLRDLPDGENITMSEWLLAATQAWGSWLLNSLFFLKATK